MRDFSQKRAGKVKEPEAAFAGEPAAPRKTPGGARRSLQRADKEEECQRTDCRC